jgi:hypothetical protein
MFLSTFSAAVAVCTLLSEYPSELVLKTKSPLACQTMPDMKLVDSSGQKKRANIWKVNKLAINSKIKNVNRY